MGMHPKTVGLYMCTHTHLQTHTHTHTHVQNTMTSFTLPTQAALNGATYEQLNTLMEMVYNTYKLEGFSWDKASKDFLKERCEEWGLKATGKKDDLTERLQQAQMALENGSEEEEEEQEEEDFKKKLKKLKKSKSICMDTLPKEYWDGLWMDGEGTGTIRFDQHGPVIGMIAEHEEDPENPWINTGVYKAEDYDDEEDEEDEEDEPEDPPKKKAKKDQDTPAQAAAKAILATMSATPAPKKVTKTALKEEAKTLGIKRYTVMTPEELTEAIRDAKTKAWKATTLAADMSDSDSDSDSDDEDELKGETPMVWCGKHTKFD